MPTPRLTTDEQDAQILRMERPDEEIGKDFGLTSLQIWNRRYYLRARILKIKGRKPSRLSGKEHVVRQLIQRGKWVSEMAKELEVTPGTVHGVIYRKKLRKRPVTRFDDPRVIIQKTRG